MEIDWETFFSLPKLAALADQNDAEFFGHLSAEKREALMESLKEIAFRHDLKDFPTQ